MIALQEQNKFDHIDEYEMIKCTENNINCNDRDIDLALSSSNNSHHFIKPSSFIDDDDYHDELIEYSKHIHFVDDYNQYLSLERSNAWFYEIFKDHFCMKYVETIKKYVQIAFTFSFSILFILH